MLRIFDVKMAEFKMQLLAAWDEDGTFDVLGEAEDDESDEEDGGAGVMVNE